MRTTMRVLVVCLASSTLLMGCSAREDTDTLGFESIEMAGVTTDHASTGGVSWVDYDGDGDPDLFVANGYDVSAEAPVGQPNQLYRNDGDAGFATIADCGLVVGASYSSASTWGTRDKV